MLNSMTKKKKREADGEPLREIIANNRKICLPATRPPVLLPSTLHARLTARVWGRKPQAKVWATEKPKRVLQLTRMTGYKPGHSEESRSNKQPGGAPERQATKI